MNFTARRDSVHISFYGIKSWTATRQRRRLTVGYTVRTCQTVQKLCILYLENELNHSSDNDKRNNVLWNFRHRSSNKPTSSVQKFQTIRSFVTPLIIGTETIKPNNYKNKFAGSPSGSDADNIRFRPRERECLLTTLKISSPTFRGELPEIGLVSRGGSKARSGRGSEIIGDKYGIFIWTQTEHNRMSLALFMRGRCRPSAT
ncbi:hypothetical protein EVAR_53772_1 [Eumeta japonica]|uniref:Uncharacterized protein n=1 Tax=Eumeta variegata TaxID=151549 RepID=A0A4C1Z5G4_EUMVA|nr:hypothetical protein EVAR_53772_1 [Eumeta japonica]